MTEKKLDEILFELKRLKLIEDGMIELSESQKIMNETLYEVLAELRLKKPEPKRETFMKEEIIEAKSISNFALPKTGKYQWYRLMEDASIKVRKCTNEGCLLFLKWDDTKKKYEHWKYDANTGVGGFVQDKCDFYGG